MKKHSLILMCFILCLHICYSQPKGKKKEEEKPPTQKEMEEMMKEMQKAMGEMSAEDKKAMDSLGIKMPDAKQMQKNMSGVSDGQLKKAWEDENRIVPLKDETRIASISKTALNASSMSAFVNAAHAKVVSLLKNESKTLAEKIYAQLKAKGTSTTAIGNCAAALWMLGRMQPALYIMGKITIEDPSNTDNIGNYASMLSMCGFEQTAIPMLNYLNTKFPNNSTILNNLGQAWFGLGDMVKSEKYLDSTIRIYAYHPQANFTRSFIEEEKGNKTEAINLVKKSLKHSYSQEKNERARKLGYKLTASDVNLPEKTNNDPLNLGSATPPPFPKSVDESIALEPEWKSYRMQLENEAKGLKQQYEDAKKRAADMQQKRVEENMKMIQASFNAGAPQGNIDLVPMHAEVAYLKQREVTDEYAKKQKALADKVVAASQQLAKLKKDYDDVMEKLQEQDTEQTGEGKPNKDFCPRYKEASDNFLRSYNPIKESLFKEQMLITKTYLNDNTYWQMFSEWPENYEALKIAAKMSWDGAIAAKAPYDFESITKFKCALSSTGKAGKLANFDDVACKYHSELNLIFGKIKTDCSRMTSEIDAGFLKLGLKQDMDQNTFGDKFMSCNIEVGMQAGKEVKAGPLTVGASVGGRMGVEIDRSGVKDVYVVGGAGASVGANVGVDLSVGGGMEGKISLVSGKGSIYGTGMFEK